MLSQLQQALMMNTNPNPSVTNTNAMLNEINSLNFTQNQIQQMKQQMGTNININPMEMFAMNPPQQPQNTVQYGGNSYGQG